MLIEIRCDKFRTGAVAFGPGLNVVLGDENATNSIGKSTLLMVIDFALGGGSLLEHNKDLVKELGDHDYYFVFRFDEEIYRFRRGTAEPTVVYICDERFEPERFLDLEKYTAFLKGSYGLDIPHLSFRSLVGLYVRVWGKKNLSVGQPLHVVPEQKSQDCVDTLLKTFERYDTIYDLSEKVKSTEAKDKALRQAKRQSIVSKVGKRQYADNEERIATIERELADIRSNLAKYATNLSAVVNREVLELKQEKDRLLALRLTVEGRLQRVRRNLGENRKIRKGSFAELTHFFPAINEERLERVEDFHNDVSRLLKVELTQSANQLEQQLGQLDRAIRDIDDGMASTLSAVEEPGTIVDRVYDLSRELTLAKEQNERYEVESALQSELQSLRSLLDEEKQKVLSLVQAAVNDGMARIIRSAFGEDRKSPRLELRDKSYSFEVSDDTGTGTAYASVLVFDLAVFLATRLPVVAHDTLLFKNIENSSVANLINVYLGTSKQSFVALDEIRKYGAETAQVLIERSVIQLDDQNVLYTKDWRMKNQN